MQTEALHFLIFYLDCTLIRREAAPLFKTVVMLPMPTQLRGILNVQFRDGESFHRLPLPAKSLMLLIQCCEYNDIPCRKQMGTVQVLVCVSVDAFAYLHKLAHK